MKLSIWKFFSIGFVVFSLGMSSHSLDQMKTKAAALRPAIDSSSIRDTQSPREQLNRLNDSRGSIETFGDFLRKNFQSTQYEKGVNTESKQKLALQDSPNGNRSTESTLEPNRSKGVVLLPGPKFTIFQQVRPSQVRDAALAASRPASFVADFEATKRPTLQAPISVGSEDIPDFGKSVPIAAYYQLGPVLPGGNGGPTPRPVLPNAVPSATGAATFAPPPTTYIPPTYAQPPTTYAQPPMTYVQPPPTYVQPPMTYVPPPTTYVQPPMTYVPPPTTYVPPPTTYVPQPSVPERYPQGNVPPMTSRPIAGQGTIPTNPSATLAAPSPYYPRNPAPMRSPCYGTPRSNTINGPPFVCPPPRQFDAKYMVSPSVCRQ